MKTGIKQVVLFFLILQVGLVLAQKPNIVLIMADDMGYECLGSNGSTEYKTPNLDRLAREGLCFNNCYSQPICTPSRVKIMTGKFNSRNYEEFAYLNPNQKTFGNLLQEAGYATCIAGKWQLNGSLNKDKPGSKDVSSPYHFGFDEYCLWQLNRPKNEGERFANALITQNGSDLPRDPNVYGPQVFADYISDFIERKADVPFFVYYPMVLVHDPFVPTPDSPEWSEPERRMEKDTAYFSDMMTYTDKIIGQLESKLKEKGVWENTLFIFTADNGTHISIMSSTTLGNVQGAKGKTINTGNHVPFILSWPDKMKGKRELNQLISFADILPTICDVAGISSDKFKTDGKSIIPLVSSEVDKIQDEIFIHYNPPPWAYYGELHNRWVMNSQYKLYRDGRFFNTKKDPLEIHDMEELTERERLLKEKFGKILDEKEDEIPFVKK